MIQILFRIIVSTFVLFQFSALFLLVWYGYINFFLGTKAGGVGQAYQQQSQQGQQVYMTYEPALQAANYLPGAGVMQRGPGGPPVQNSVVPGLQPSSSYYSGSTGKDKFNTISKISIFHNN